ncbi:MAG: response regulator [Bacteroidetes bacterium]|nr:response regulator [Bacteroidota bacterium]
METVKKIKIIYAEDSRSLSHLVISKLSAENFDVMHFKSGKGVVDAVISNQPSVVILDNEMPEINGMTILEELKNTDSTKNIPVIFFTTIKDQESVIKCLKLGVTDYIVKDSLALSNLIPRIKKYIS